MTLDRTLHHIDATLAATTRPRPIQSQEDRMRDARTDAAQPDDGINLTEQQMTPESRAALYPSADRVPAPRADHGLTTAETLRRQRDDLRRELTQTRDALTQAGLEVTDTVSTPELADRLTTERDTARDTARREFQALRKQLLAALHQDDDNQTLASYITALAADRDQALERLRQLHTLPEHHTHLHNRITALENDARSQDRAVRELTTERDQARRLNNQLANEIGRKQDTINAQAEQIRRDDTLLCRLRDLDEQRDRAWAEHDTTTGPQQIDNPAALRAAARHLRLLAEDHAEDSLGFGIGWAADALDTWADTPDEAPAAGLGSPADRAQDIRPADWEQRATDAITDAWTHVEDDAAISAQRLAEIAVRAIIDAGLAGAGGRCRKCGATYPRTLPAGQDPLCWTCDSEEQTGVDEPAATLAQIERDAAQLHADLAAGLVDDHLGQPTRPSHDHTTGIPTFAPDAELVVRTSDGPQQWTGARWNEHVHAAWKGRNGVPERLITCPPSVCTTACPANVAREG